MKAAVLREFGKDLVLDEVPKIGSQDVGYSRQKFSADPTVFVWKELELIGCCGNTHQNIIDVIEPG